MYERRETRHRLRRAVACLPSRSRAQLLERKRPGSRPQGVPGCFDKETFGGAPVIEQRGQLAVIVNPTEFGASNRKAQSVSY